MKFYQSTILFLLFNCGFYANAQFNTNLGKHLEEINSAKLYMYEGKIDSAISCYKLAIDYWNDDKNAYFDLGRIYEQKRDFANAIVAYRESVLKGFFPCTGMHLDGFPDENSPAELLPFIQSLDSLKGIFYTKKFNWEFSDLVKRLSGADQFPRDKEDALIGNDTINHVELSRILGMVDTGYTLSKLLDYMNNHTFPLRSSIDEETAVRFWLIVHHNLQYDTTDPLVVKLQSYVKNAVYQGQYSVYNYIISLDYKYMGKYKKQYYGTYKEKNQLGQYTYSRPIDDIENVDKRRAEWHMFPLYLEQKANELHPLPPGNYKIEKQKK